eukprot:346916-Pelagomonas_calceolata.AAC.1
MKELGCYTDRQRQEIDEADTWARPACAGLDIAQKIGRECQSKEELIRVTWLPREPFQPTSTLPLKNGP